MALLDSVGRRLRAVRREKGMGQAELASAIGVHPKTVSRWENDSQPPEIPALEAAAAVLGVTSDWLRNGGELPAATTMRVAERPPSFSYRARSFINRFLAELADAGVTPDEEEWARRVLMNPDNVGYNIGGHTPTLDEEAMLRDIEGMSIGVRLLLRNRGYKNLAPR